MLLQLSQIPPFIPLHPAHWCPPTFPHLSSCPWVIYVSSLAFTFPILFSTSPCLFSTYHLCYLFPHFLLPFPAYNPTCDPHFCDSVSVLVVCLVHFWLLFCFVWGIFLGSVVDNCEFAVILVFIFLIFFFLDKSL